MPPISHSMLSPSSAFRWLNCTPSARLAKDYAEKRESKWADEGTCAHDLCEFRLIETYVRETGANLTCEHVLQDIQANKYYSKEMEEHCAKYVDYIWDYFDSENDFLFIEERLKLTDWIAEENSKGTSDASIIKPTELHIFDFKYGERNAINAIKNEQLMIYALGFYSANKELIADTVETVILHIVQPRMRNYSYWEISLTNLLEFGKCEVYPKSKYAIIGEGDLIQGSWCKYCPVLGRCTEITNKIMQIPNKKDWADAHLLTPEQLAVCLDLLPHTKEWYTKVEEEANRLAINGTEIPGYKLVRTGRRTQITDELSLIRALDAAGFDNIYKSSGKLLGVTELKKLGPKAVTILNKYTTKTDGKLKLVKADIKQYQQPTAQDDFAHLL